MTDLGSGSVMALRFIGIDPDTAGGNAHLCGSTRSQVTCCFKDGRSRIRLRWMKSQP